MNNYQKQKERIREKAISFYDDFPVLSWSELQEWTDYFYRQGKKYGLLQEFRENGII